MDQRGALIADWLREEWTMTELAQRYDISRKTAYKWVDRYTADPAHGLTERSRAPHAHGRALPAPVQEAVVALRQRYPHWGPKKLRAVLQWRHPRRVWPAASTMGDLLRREGLSTPRRRERYVVPLTQPLAAAVEPNDVWTADFKGWFRTTDRTHCDPLTMADACSRLVLCCHIVPPTEAGVRPWFDRTFREYGLPRALRTDNGSPFATTGPGRCASRRSSWGALIATRAGLPRRGTGGASAESAGVTLWKCRSYGNHKRFPQELGNLAQNARFPQISTSESPDGV